MTDETLLATLGDVRDETVKLRTQLRTERWWRRGIALALVLTVGVGVRAEVVRRDNDHRDDRNSCLSANESRGAIRDAFTVLISTSLQNVPPDDPRRARADAFMADLNARLPDRDCG